MAATTLSPTTQDRILDASERLLAAMGLRKMTMEDVAREAGLTRRTVYTYFRSKQDLAFGVIDRVAQEVYARLERIAASEGTPAERLRQMAVARIVIRLDAVQEYRLSLDTAFEVIRPAYIRRRKQYFYAEAAIVANVIREGNESGEFKGVDPDSTASLLLFSTNHFLPYSLKPSELGTRARTLHRLKTLATIFVDGISDCKKVIQ